MKQVQVGKLGRQQFLPGERGAWIRAVNRAIESAASTVALSAAVEKSEVDA